MFGTQILVYATTFFSSYELVLVLLGQIDLEGMIQAAGIPGLLFFLVSPMLPSDSGLFPSEVLCVSKRFWYDVSTSLRTQRGRYISFRCSSS